MLIHLAKSKYFLYYNIPTISRRPSEVEEIGRRLPGQLWQSRRRVISCDLKKLNTKQFRMASKNILETHHYLYMF